MVRSTRIVRMPTRTTTRCSSCTPPSWSKAHEDDHRREAADVARSWHKRAAREGSGVNLAKVLPLAFVMIAGPQILSAIFLATSENWRRNSAAFVAGAAVSITTFVTIAFFLSDGASDEGASGDTLDVIFLVVLVAAGLHTFLTRSTSKPPKWMGKLQTAQPKLSFKLGFLLLGVFPTDILTSIAVGGSLARHGDPWWHVLPFVLLTLLLIALPSLLVIALGQRGKTLLPKVRDWMNNNSWIVSEIVIGLFIIITVSSLAG
jgi:threonine/homoserine/homoserine lactone efflux protein